MSFDHEPLNDNTLETPKMLDSLHELSENDLLSFWQEVFQHHFYYHGTNSLAYEMIKKTGEVSPTTRVWRDDYLELERLLIKAGNEQGLGIPIREEISFTPYRATGVSYAQRSPETWTLFVGTQAWLQRNKSAATMNIYRSLNNDITKLSEPEREMAKTIFDTYWELFEPSIPVLLTFSPAIMDSLLTHPVLTDFLVFKDYIKAHPDTYHTTFTDLLRAEIQEDSPISLDYLVKTEQLEKPIFKSD